AGGLSKEYKTKFRSLVFNLKDANNPDLRARVLQGELAPDALVLLSTAELASRQLSAWRQQKEEEFAKAKFLDDEAASKFSTAAAALLKSQRHSEMQKVNDKLINTQEALMGSGANARDDTQEGAQARAAAAAAAAAAGEAHHFDLVLPHSARPAAAAGGAHGAASAEAGAAGDQLEGKGPGEGGGAAGSADAVQGNGLSLGIGETLGPSKDNSTELTTT
ncbi:transcription factor S-II, central domain-containing protein, partial [Dunaliella salina]